MITFTALADDHTLIGLGLSEMNIQRLKEGKPILNKNVPGYHIMIFYGETEEDMQRELQAFIGPNTQVKEDGRS